MTTAPAPWSSSGGDEKDFDILINSGETVLPGMRTKLGGDLELGGGGAESESSGAFGAQGEAGALASGTSWGEPTRSKVPDMDTGGDLGVGEVGYDEVARSAG